MRRQTRELLRIQQGLQGQPVLEAQDEVREQHPHQAENEHGDGVPDPILLPLRVDATDTVGKALDGLEHGIEPGLAMRIQHLEQVEPEGFGDQEKGAHVKRELQPGIRIVHGDPVRTSRDTALPRPGR